MASQLDVAYRVACYRLDNNSRGAGKPRQRWDLNAVEVAQQLMRAYFFGGETASLENQLSGRVLGRVRIRFARACLRQAANGTPGQKCPWFSKAERAAAR